MTVKFTVHTGNPEQRMDGVMDDLGLCFVSRFTVDGQEMLSISSQDVTVNDRLTRDHAVLEEYGYYDLVPVL